MNRSSSNEMELKRTLAHMFGVGLLSSSVTLAPIQFDPTDFQLITSAALAKDSEDSGESGESGDSSGSSGSEGSGESGESGDSGESGGNSGSSGSGGNSGSGKSGRSQESGNRNESSSTQAIPSRFGHVVRFRATSNGLEIRYSDGWRETIDTDRYSLTNAKGRTVISRRVRRSDWQRMNSAQKKKRSFLGRVFRRKESPD